MCTAARRWCAQVVPPVSPELTPAKRRLEREASSFSVLPLLNKDSECGAHLRRAGGASVVEAVAASAIFSSEPFFGTIITLLRTLSTSACTESLRVPPFASRPDSISERCTPRLPTLACPFADSDKMELGVAKHVEREHTDGGGPGDRHVRRRLFLVHRGDLQAHPWRPGGGLRLCRRRP